MSFEPKRDWIFITSSSPLKKLQLHSCTVATESAALDMFQLV